MDEAAVANALRVIGQGFYDLGKAIHHLGADQTAKEEPGLALGRKPRADERVVNINAAKEKVAAAKEAYPAAGLKALGKLDIAEATRPELKEVAEALGVYQQGQKASELRELLSGILTREVASHAQPAKGGKKGAAPPVEEDVEEPTYPEPKAMKKEFKLFCKVNRAAIEEEQADFFDDDSDSDNPEERLHQILADEDLLKTAWRDNVWDTKQRGEWDDLLKEAEAQVG